MANNYSINATDGTLKFILQSNEKNTPGLPASHTDLTMVGPGQLQWGETNNENFLRLLENFACPESTVTPGTPKTAAELGIAGAGVNDPVNGQLWFNTTKQSMFVFLSTGWQAVNASSSGGSLPPTANVGDIFYDTSVPQLKVWTGSAWVSVADRYVLKSGDTMTGDLIINADLTVSGGADNVGAINMAGTTSNNVNFGTAGSGNPNMASATRSAGTKLVLRDSFVQNTNLDVAVGSTATSLWFSCDTQGTGFRWFAPDGLGGQVSSATLSGNGSLFVNDIINIAGASSGEARLNLNNSTKSTVNIGGGSAAPTFSGAGINSVGTKVVLYPQTTVSTVDHAIGLEPSATWFSVPTSTHVFKFYGGITEAVRISGAGIISLTGPNFDTESNPASGTISLNNNQSNLIRFSGVGVAPPSYSNRSRGSKIVLYPEIGSSSVDYAIGIDGSTLWTSVPSSTRQFKWYAGTNNILTLSGVGNMTLMGNMTTTGSVTAQSNAIINNAAPTLYMQDTDQRSAMLHCNGGTLYILRGTGNNSLSWAVPGTGYWGFQHNIDTGTTQFGNSITVKGDIVSHRIGGENQGIIWLGNTGARYLHFDGGNYVMPNSDLYVNGYRAVTTSPVNMFLIPKINGKARNLGGSPAWDGSDAGIPVSITRTATGRFTMICNGMSNIVNVQVSVFDISNDEGTVHISDVTSIGGVAAVKFKCRSGGAFYNPDSGLMITIYGT